jgi:hypothetical protein
VKAEKEKEKCLSFISKNTKLL